MSYKETFNPALYLVTDRELVRNRSLEWLVEQAVKGGVTIVQLREKDLTTKDFVTEAYNIKQIVDRYQVPLVINDRLDVALAVNADGLHIGQSDMPYEKARQILGENAIIGLSVENFEQAEAANKYDLDYIAASPVFTTPTKSELTGELGIEGVQKISSLSRHPVIGIGSLKAHNAASVIQAGAQGVAVVSGICSAEDPEEAARELRREVDNANKQ